METENKPASSDAMVMNSAEVAEIAKALAASALPNPKKTHTANVVSNRTGGKFKYHYADLSEIIETVQQPLAKNGLIFTQIVTKIDGNLTLVTKLIHTSGQWLASHYPLPSLTDSQAMGSAITYARRYSLCAILGIAAEDDEDGNKATEESEAQEQAAEESKKQEARNLLEQAKKEGRVRSAYTGELIKPGEDVKPPEATTPPTATPEQKKQIDPQLVAAMEKSGITPDQLKAVYVKLGHKPATMDVCDLPKDYIEIVLKPNNWAKIIATIKGGK